MFLKILKTAAMAAAVTSMPVSAVAASSASMLSVAATMQSDSTANDDDDFAGLTQYAIPVVIVLVLAIGLYFALEDDEGGSSV